MGALGFVIAGNGHDSAITLVAGQRHAIAGLNRDGTRGVYVHAPAVDVEREGTVFSVGARFEANILRDAANHSGRREAPARIGGELLVVGGFNEADAVIEEAVLGLIVFLLGDAAGRPLIF